MRKCCVRSQREGSNISRRNPDSLKCCAVAEHPRYIYASKRQFKIVLSLSIFYIWSSRKRVGPATLLGLAERICLDEIAARGCYSQHTRHVNADKEMKKRAGFQKLRGAK